MFVERTKVMVASTCPQDYQSGNGNGRSSHTETAHATHSHRAGRGRWRHGRLHRGSFGPRLDAKLLTPYHPSHDWTRDARVVAPSSSARCPQSQSEYVPVSSRSDLQCLHLIASGFVSSHMPPCPGRSGVTREPQCL